MTSELEEYVKHQLEVHKEILLIVKRYIDNILRDVFLVDPNEMQNKDPSTYFAIIMEIVRSIYVNYSVEKRSKQQKR
jgi:hypothetical protein